MAIAEKKAKKYTESAPKSLFSPIHNKAYKASFHSSEIPQEQRRHEHGEKKILKFWGFPILHSLVLKTNKRGLASEILGYT